MGGYHEIETTIDLRVEVNGHVNKYIPAKINAPMCDCYPEEGGDVDDLNVMVLLKCGNITKRFNIIEMLDKETLEALENALLEDEELNREEC